MRVFFAALFVIVGMVVFCSLFADTLREWPPAVAAFFVAIVFVGLVAMAIDTFNLPLAGSKPKFWPEQIAEWERQGLLISTDYQALRAFKVASFDGEGEGQHYFVELSNHAVLYLNGYWLNEHEESYRSAGQEPQERSSFPCTEFTVRRHRNGSFGDIICRGVPLAVETLELTFPEDGNIITSISFDDLRRLAEGAAQAFGTSGGDAVE